MEESKLDVLLFQELDNPLLLMCEGIRCSMSLQHLDGLSLLLRDPNYLPT